jgi:predicted metal-dependent phosphoesterase TrpH
MAKYTTNQQINEIINTDLYKSGKPFTIAEMTEICTSTNYASRMNELLRYLVDDGYVRSYGNQLNLLYSRAGEKWLKKRWVSEMAESICDGDYCGNLTGKTSLDVRERTQTLSAIS